MLAKLLLQNPALLMLDEPTNHLDLPSIEWVEKYVNTYEGAIIVVSHDRYFLDNTVDTIVEVSGRKAQSLFGQLFLLHRRKSPAERNSAGRFRKPAGQNPANRALY